MGNNTGKWLLLAVFLFAAISKCGSWDDGNLFPSSGYREETAGTDDDEPEYDIQDRGTPCVSADGKMNPLGGSMEVAVTGAGRPVETGMFTVGENAVRIDPDTGKARNHTGIDIAAEVGTPVYAIEDGVAEYGWTGFVTGYGNTVTIDTSSGMSMLYAHLDRMTVRPGQTIKKGQLIGYTGKSGNAANVPNAHLHFEVRRGPAIDKDYVDPAPYLNGTPDRDSGLFVDMDCNAYAASLYFEKPSDNYSYSDKYKL